MTWHVELREGYDSMKCMQSAASRQDGVMEGLASLSLGLISAVFWRSVVHNGMMGTDV